LGGNDCFEDVQKKGISFPWKTQVAVSFASSFETAMLIPNFNAEFALENKRGQVCHFQR
jgi:hypothetical protein